MSRKKTTVQAEVKAKATYQPRGGRGRSTTRQTVSVTPAKSAPPSTNGARRAGSLPVLSSNGKAMPLIRATRNWGF